MSVFRKEFQKMRFGHWWIEPGQIFHETQHSFCFVNNRPATPGHVLVSPIQAIPELEELQQELLDDLLQTGQAVYSMLLEVYSEKTCYFFIQNKAAAGQTVPHVHLHIMPSFIVGSNEKEMMEGNHQPKSP